MASPSEEIKEKLDIVDVLKEYIELHPAGRNFKARCPFHAERTPSFMVSPERQIWHCFGCGEGGDIFTFVMKYENIDFPEALKHLAEKAGVDIKRSSPRDHQEFGVLYDINREATEFFKEQFIASDRAQEYIRERELPPEVIESFEIGFAPQGYDTLIRYLTKQGYAVSDIVRAGLAFRTEKGRYLDRFNGRVMFPIHNHFGKVVGFSGRILPELDTGKMGKYINSPETPIFNKSRLLYGFWQTKGDIREKNEAVLVEGQMDFLMLYGAGIKHAVASSGTALTGDHLKTLRRFAETLVFIFDNDPAGALAIERGIDMANESDFNSRVLLLEKYKDPADAIIAEKDFFEKALPNSKTAMEYLFDKKLSVADSIEKKKVASKFLLGKIKRLQSSVEQNHWIKELSFRLGVSEKELVAEMDRVSASGDQYNRNIDGNNESISRKQSLPKERINRIAWHILEIAIIDERYVPLVKDMHPYFSDPFKEMYAAIGSGDAASSSIKPTVDTLYLSASQSPFQELAPHRLEEEFAMLKKEFLFEHHKRVLARIKQDIAVSESKGDEEALKSLLKAFDDTSRKMQDIRNGNKQKAKKENSV
jgi:DNA primase